MTKLEELTKKYQDAIKDVMEAQKNGAFTRPEGALISAKFNPAPLYASLICLKLYGGSKSIPSNLFPLSSLQNVIASL